MFAASCVQFHFALCWWIIFCVYGDATSWIFHCNLKNHPLIAIFSWMSPQKIMKILLITFNDCFTSLGQYCSFNLYVVVPRERIFYLFNLWFPMVNKYDVDVELRKRKPAGVTADKTGLTDSHNACVDWIYPILQMQIQNDLDKVIDITSRSKMCHWISFLYFFSTFLSARSFLSFFYFWLHPHLFQHSNCLFRSNESWKVVSLISKIWFVYLRGQ